MQSDAQRRATAKYRKDNVKNVSVKFYPSEKELFDFLDSKGGRASYIKQLLREAMERERG